jgi:hypothetical protein
MTRALVAALAVFASIAPDAHAQTPSLSSRYVSVGEASGFAQVQVTLSPAPTERVDVSWQTSRNIMLADARDALPGEDFIAASGTLTFAAGETAKDITVTLIDDTIDEGSEVFGVHLGLETPPREWAVVDIVDDDPSPAPSIADATVRENAGEVSLAVTRPAVSHLGNMRWAWTVRAGSATLDQDVPAASGEIGLGFRDTATTISLRVNDDAVDEPDETFLVELTPLSPTNPWFEVTGTAPADGLATVTIVDDDPAPAAQGPLLTRRSGTVRLQPTAGSRWQILRSPVAIAPGARVDTRRGSANLAGAVLAGGMFEVRSASEIQLTGGRRARCGQRIRSLAVRARPGLQVRGRRAVTEAAGGPARWTIADGCRGTTVRVRRGRVTVRSAQRVFTLRRGQVATYGR